MLTLTIQHKNSLNLHVSANNVPTTAPAMFNSAQAPTDSTSTNNVPTTAPAMFNSAQAPTDSTSTNNVPTTAPAMFNSAQAVSVDIRLSKKR